MKHLGVIRKSFNVLPQSTTTPEQAPSVPRARRPAPNTTTPTLPRIARPPGIPGIIEDDETNISGTQDTHGFIEEDAPSLTPHRRKSKPRSSLSRHPGVEEVPGVQFDEDLNKTGKRKPTRRHSGLLSTKVAITTVLPTGIVSEALMTRPPSPAFGSPSRRDTALDEEDEVLAVISAPEPMDEDEDEDPVAMTVTRRDKKKKPRERELERNVEWDRDLERERDRELVAGGSRRDREKRRVRDSDDGPNPLEAKKPKLKDVTNSPPPRPSLATLEIPPGMLSTDHEK